MDANAAEQVEEKIAALEIDFMDANAAEEVDPVPQRSTMRESKETRVDDHTRRHCGSHTHARMEVFSVVTRVADGEKYHWFESYCGVIVLRSCDQDFVLFDADALEPEQINSEGYVTLTGPSLSIPVEDEVVIFPWFIDLTLCHMKKIQTTLWKAKSDEMDQFICRTINIILARYLDVSFAVYSDAVEAHLDVYLVGFGHGRQDSLRRVNGTVSASNSFLSDSKAKSFLFHKSHEEWARLEPGNTVPLPLSRRITVVPRQSTLFVHVSIVVDTELGELDIKDTVMFNPSLNSTEESIILIPNRGTMLVKVNWVDT